MTLVPSRWHSHHRILKIDNLIRGCFIYIHTHIYIYIYIYIYHTYVYLDIMKLISFSLLRRNAVNRWPSFEARPLYHLGIRRNLLSLPLPPSLYMRVCVYVRACACSSIMDIPSSANCWEVFLCLSNSSSTAWAMGTIIAVVAVLLIHIDKKAVVIMKPNISLKMIKDQSVSIN